MTETSTQPEFSFLATSEAGLHISSMDWSEHPLGEPDSWDPLLLNTLNIILESAFPMFLYWGENNLCFYNDAFMPTLGQGKNQLAGIGKPLPMVFPEIVEPVDALITRVKTTGERVFFEDFPSMLIRNGVPVETYWTYSYSPVKDLKGNVQGVLSVCIETTDKVKSFNLAKANEHNFRNAFTQAPVGLLIVRGPERIIEFANELYLKIVDRDLTCVGKPLWDVLYEVKAQGFDKLMESVYSTGVPFRSAEHAVQLRKNGVMTTGYYTFSYEAIRERDGSIESVMAMVVDVTEQVEARKKVELAEQRLRQAVDATQLGTFDFNLITEEMIASERFYQIFGFVYKAPHASLVDAIHPEDRKIREAAHRRAYATGHLSYETRILWKNDKVRWIRINGIVNYDDDRNPVRIIGSVLDITEEKEIRTQLTDTAERLDLALMAGKLGTFEWDVHSDNLVCNTQCKADFGLAPEHPFNLSIFLSRIVAADKERVKRALDESIKNCTPYQAEYRVKWNDNSIHCIRASGLPLRDKKGKVTRMIGITRELSGEACAYLD